MDYQVFEKNKKRNANREKTGRHPFSFAEKW